MKRIFILSAIFFFLFLTANFYADAQKVVTTKDNALTSPKMDEYKKQYSLAMKYADYACATQSVFAMMTIDTGSIALKDTLANLFFARGMYSQCLFLGKEIFSKQPDNNRVLELLAVSEQSLGNGKEALDYYEKLYPRTKQLFHLYQMVILQYGLKRIGECNLNIESIINDPNSEKEQIVMNVGQGYQQRVPLKAAAMNIKGVIAKDLNEIAVAKKYFEEALKIFPDFVIAKSNLDELSKPSDTEMK